MGLLGERCVRCGEVRTRRQFEGLPTCESCEARIRGDREQPRTCPVDGREMHKEVVLNIVIDRCPACEGVWLDAGELALLREASRNGGTLAESFFLNSVGRL